MKSPTVLVMIASALLIAGCKDKETISTYTVPKEESKATIPGATAQAQPAPAPPAPPSGGTMNALPGMAEQSQEFNAPNFQAPEHWEAQPLGSMRKGSWKIIEGDAIADVSVLAFPGDVGGDLANINRWRGQVGLPTIDETTLASSLTAIPVGTLQGKYVSLINNDAGQGIAGVILPKDGATWFFKMTGPAPLVTKEIASFKQLVANTQF